MHCGSLTGTQQDQPHGTETRNSKHQGNATISSATDSELEEGEVRNVDGGPSIFSSTQVDHINPPCSASLHHWEVGEHGVFDDVCTVVLNNVSRYAPQAQTWYVVMIT